MLIYHLASENIFDYFVGNFTESGILIGHLCKALCIANTCFSDRRHNSIYLSLGFLCQFLLSSFRFLYQVTHFLYRQKVFVI